MDTSTLTVRLGFPTQPRGTLTLVELEASPLEGRALCLVGLQPAAGLAAHGPATSRAPPPHSLVPQAAHAVLLHTQTHMMTH